MARLTLWIGALVAPIFFATVYAQAAVRVGYSVRRVPLSLLSLGNYGWIQIDDFKVCGVLALISAVGFRATLAGHRGGTWAPLLTATYGLGLVVAGTWHPDPGLGFPPGTPDKMATPISGHYILHWVGFFLVVLSLFANCFVFYRLHRAWGQHGWSRYSLASGIVGIVSVAVGLASNDYVFVTGAATVIFFFHSATAARLAVSSTARRQTSAASPSYAAR